MPMFRLWGARVTISRPSTLMLPEFGRTKPAIVIRSVVLPEPDGPSSVRNSPALIETEMSSRTLSEP